MQSRYGKGIAAVLVTCVFVSEIISLGTFAAGVTEEKYDEYDNYESDTYIAMDEEGNVTLIPLDEVETPDAEELAAIDNIYYEIVVEVEGEESIVNIVETEEEADEEVEAIQVVIDEQDTVEAAVEEIVNMTESEELVEILENMEETPVVDTSASLTTHSGATMNDSVISITIEGLSTATVASEKAITVTSQKVTQEVTYGVVVFNSSSLIYYTDVNGGVYGTDGGYISSSYGPDAAYLGTTSSGDIMYMQSGVVGLIDVSDYASGAISVIDYDTYVSQGKVTSYYYTSNGTLYHALTTNTTSIASTQIVGYQQSYMSNNTTYYSYDGHYFYTSYKAMVKDYTNNTYDNAINADEPYYNYYQYLSHRTTTEYTGDQIDEYLDAKISSSSSVLLDMGDYFIEYQDDYGVNAILMLGVAINESAWGTSSIATSKNNLFGHGAVDSNPYYGANGYDTASDSILYHAKNFISYGYMDATTDSRYYGSHLGNKQSGVSVKYASDPYWGEKAASQCWSLDVYYGDEVEDVYTETIGIVNGSASIYESPGGSVLFYLKNKNASTSWEMPVVILGETTKSGVLYYKIQSDMGLYDDRSGVYCYEIYDFDEDYAYIKASDVYIYCDGTDGDSSGNTSGSTDDSTDSGTDYMLGDVNGDDKISAVDYMMIKAYIMETTTITGTYLDAADVNRDNQVSSIDYMMIKAHIMGTYTIE